MERGKIAGQFDIESKKVQSENRYNQLNNQLESIIQKGATQARGLNSNLWIYFKRNSSR